MKLESVLNNTGAVILHGTPGTEITAITSDSRKAAPGSLFIAVKGVDRTGTTTLTPPWRRAPRPSFPPAGGAWRSAPTTSTAILPAS